MRSKGVVTAAMEGSGVASGIEAIFSVDAADCAAANEIKGLGIRGNGGIFGGGILGKGGMTGEAMGGNGGMTGDGMRGKEGTCCTVEVFDGGASAGAAGC